MRTLLETCLSTRVALDLLHIQLANANKHHEITFAQKPLRGSVVILLHLTRKGLTYLKATQNERYDSASR
jgi:hypothetical protein